MTGPTRRSLLTGCGVGLAALAGCSGFPGLGGDDERPEYDPDALAAAVEGVDSALPPDAFPVRLPAALQDAHRERGLSYLDTVPVAPSFPNEEMARKLADQRSDALADLERDASGRPRDRLETWRRRRTAAANVRGAYLAATGDVGAGDVESGRAQVRARLASFEAEWTYRATDPVAAAVVHETLERYVESCRRHLHGSSTFPDDPGDAVFRVGDIVGELDEANAAVVDVERLRQQYQHGAGETTGYRQRLAATAERLRHSLGATTSDLDAYVGVEADAAFDRELEGTPAGHLFDAASRAVEWRSEEADRASRRHVPATAVVETGRALVAAGALEAVVEAVRNGTYQDYATVDDVEAAAERVQDALETAWAATPQSLAVELAEPATMVLGDVARQVREGYGGPDRVLASIVHAEAQARAVPAATAFVTERLQSQGSN